MLDVATVKASVPKNIRNYVTQEFVDKLHNVSSDPMEAETVRESAIGYMDVLNSGKYKMDSYLNAIKYVTYVSLGSSSLEAWVKVFPDKYANCVANCMPEKTIHSYASHFKKSKLVTELMDRALVPTHILNAPYYQEAINKQVELMRNAKSERIQLEASLALSTGLKKLEVAKLEIDVDVQSSSIMDELNSRTMELAVMQQELIAKKVYSVKDISNQALIIEHEED